MELEKKGTYHFDALKANTVRINATNTWELCFLKSLTREGVCNVLINVIKCQGKCSLKILFFLDFS